MKKALTVIGIILTFFFIYFLQLNFFSWFNIAGIKPNLFVIYIIFLSTFIGKKRGIVIGIILGLYIDIVNGRILGLTAIMYVLIAIFSDVMNKNVSSDTKITMIFIIALGTFLYELGYYFLSMWKLSINVEIVQFMKIVWVEVLFNSILTIILYPVIQKVGTLISDIFNKKSFLSTYF